MSLSCTRCGAALELPSDRGVDAVVCAYCGATQPVAVAHGGVDRAELERVLAHGEAQSRRNTRALLIVAASVVAAIFMMLVITRPSPIPSAPPAATVHAIGVAKVKAKPTTPATAPASTSITSPASLASVEATYGAHGTGPGQFSGARNLAVDRDGAVWITDATRRVQKLSPTGALVATIQASTTNPPQGPLSSDVDDVLGVAAGAPGSVYVSIGYDVLRYDLADASKPAAIFHGEKGRTCYRDLTLDQAGDLFARSACTDTNAYAIVKLDPRGRVLARVDEGPVWEKDATGRPAVDARGQLWIPHRYESNLQVLDDAGKLVTRFGVQGDRPGEIPRASLREVALDGRGRVYLAVDDRVDAFEVGGRYVGRIDVDRSFGAPRDLAFAPDGSLWIVGTNDVIVKYRLR